MKIKKITNPDNANLTSFYNDTIFASCNEIRSKLGIDVSYYGSADDKVHFEFELELEDGTPFTIYDWKEGEWIDEDSRVYFHIGAKNGEDSRKVRTALKSAGL